MAAAPTRIRIVGVSGSGKSRLAKRIADRTGLPRLELDAVFWDAGWQYRDLDEAHDMVLNFVEEHSEGWVIDGNWTNRLDGLLDPGAPNGASLIVWLDHPRALVMTRVISRTMRRFALREELWHGNRESIRGLLSWKPGKNIVRWAWTNYAAVRERMLQRMEAGAPVLRLRAQREVEAWIDSLEPTVH